MALLECNALFLRLRIVFVHAEASIRPISAEETIALRLPILRTGMQREDAIFPGDDAPDTAHFGAFAGTTLVGVVTVFPAPFPAQPETGGTWQLRGMATTAEVRGQGFGRELLRACHHHVKENGGTLLWCNARVPAQAFYEKAGWMPVGDVFEIPTAGPHIRMCISVA